jgi:hypothetical protein
MDRHAWHQRRRRFLPLIAIFALTAIVPATGGASAPPAAWAHATGTQAVEAATGGIAPTTDVDMAGGADARAARSRSLVSDPAVVAATRSGIAPFTPSQAMMTLATAAVTVANQGTAAPTLSATAVNMLWFPALGMTRAVTSYPCSSSFYPKNAVYRWGCAGSNNVYLFGHAWGVMKPLHDAYVAGRLRVGMTLRYADASGRVRTYRVTTWRVVLPTNTSWAIAAQPRASMTLQTCVGSRSQWRLLVRLVAD